MLFTETKLEGTFIIDLESRTDDVELTAENHCSLYIPERFAHGFQTLMDETEVIYQMGDLYTPDYACSYRYDDPAFGIEWPLPVSVISDKDREWSLFEHQDVAGLAKT